MDKPSIAATLLGLAIASFEWIAAIALVLYARFFLPYYLKSRITTMPEFLERRFNHKVRLVYAIISLIGYIVIELAVVLYTGSLAIREVFGLPLVWGLVILCVIGGGYDRDLHDDGGLGPARRRLARTRRGHGRWARPARRTGAVGRGPPPRAAIAASESLASRLRFLERANAAALNEFIGASDLKLLSAPVVALGWPAGTLRACSYADYHD